MRLSPRWRLRLVDTCDFRCYILNRIYENKLESQTMANFLEARDEKICTHTHTPSKLT